MKPILVFLLFPQILTNFCILVNQQNNLNGLNQVLVEVVNLLKITRFGIEKLVPLSGLQFL